VSRQACIVNKNDLRVGDRIIDEINEIIMPPLAFKDTDHGVVIDEEGNRYQFESQTVVVLR
jgi:hypothetical protein